MTPLFLSVNLQITRYYSIEKGGCLYNKMLWYLWVLQGHSLCHKECPSVLFMARRPLMSPIPKTKSSAVQTPLYAMIP